MLYAKHLLERSASAFNMLSSDEPLTPPAATGTNHRLLSIPCSKWDICAPHPKTNAYRLEDKTFPLTPVVYDYRNKYYQVYSKVLFGFPADSLVDILQHQCCFSHTARTSNGIRRLFQ